MNIQFGEKLLNVSPSLAAQIGLEEAVLSQLIFELSHICPVKKVNELDWFYLAPERWPELIPFWNMTKIDQVFKHLERLKIVQRHFNDNGQFLIRLVPDNAFHPAAERKAPVRTLPQWPKQNIINPARQRNQNHSDLPTFMIEQSQQLQNKQAYKSPITQNWTPDKNLLIPRLAAENIAVEFVYEQLPDFISYHLETGTSAADWNSRFIRWVKEEWSKLSRPGFQGQSKSTQRQEQRDEVRRKLMDIRDTNW